jgi:hypothetical protein
MSTVIPPMTNNTVEEFPDEGLCPCSALGAGGVTAFDNGLEGLLLSENLWSKHILHTCHRNIYQEQKNPLK